MILIILFSIIAGIANAVMDVITFREGKHIFKDQKESWKNKYKSPLQLYKKKWYLWYKPEYEEKFPYSSTMLVFLTDLWHFSKFILLLSLFILIFLVNSIIVVILARIIYGLTFVLFYNKLLIK